MTRILRLLALICLVVLSGCTSLGLEPPDLTLADLDLVEVTLLESSGTVSLRIANSNPDPLTIDGLAVNLELDGRRIGKVLFSERIEVPRLASTTLDAELYVSHLVVLSVAKEMMEMKTLDYGLSGKVYVLTDFGRRAVRVKRSGRFSFDGEAVDGESLDGETLDRLDDGTI